jgi:hypothetical protein
LSGSVNYPGTIPHWLYRKYRQSKGEDGMARSIRYVLDNQQGVTRQNFNWDAINIDTAVIVTAAEIGDWLGALSGVKTVGRPNLGAASVWVSNVGPHGFSTDEAGGVEFFLHTEWSSPLRIMVTITALEDIEQFIQD